MKWWRPAGGHRAGASGSTPSWSWPGARDERASGNAGDEGPAARRLGGRSPPARDPPPPRPGAEAPHAAEQGRAALRRRPLGKAGAAGARRLRRRARRPRCRGALSARAAGRDARHPGGQASSFSAPTHQAALGPNLGPAVDEWLRALPDQARRAADRRHRLRRALPFEPLARSAGARR